MKFPGGSQMLVKNLKQPEGDLRTVAVSQESAFQEAPVGARRAFSVLLPLLARAAGRNEVGSCLLGVVGASGKLVASIILKPGDAATIGRHSQCRLRLSDPAVSLRHLVAHVGHSSNNSLPLVRLWDLKTQKPFVAEDGESTEALAAEGPLFATLGSYSLALLPLHCGEGDWSLDVDTAWNALPPREFIARLAEGTNVKGQSATTSNVGRITHLGSTCSLEELSDKALAIAEVHVLCGGLRRTYYLEARHLERGILIGRYSRCCNDAIRDGAVSRVHLLLAASGREVYAIDTASTGGSKNEAGEVISCEALPKRTTLSIGDQTTIVWKRLETCKA